MQVLRTQDKETKISYGYEIHTLIAPSLPEDVFGAHVDAPELHGPDQLDSLGQRNISAGATLLVLVRQAEGVVHQLQLDAVEA